MRKKIDIQFAYGGINYCKTSHKCPKCGDEIVCDQGAMIDSEINREITQHEICEECGYNYDITFKITLEINAEYSEHESESCKRCDFKGEHEHVS